mgnify:CR=1 FL=1
MKKLFTVFILSLILQFMMSCNTTPQMNVYDLTINSHEYHVEAGEWSMDENDNIVFVVYNPYQERHFIIKGTNYSVIPIGKQPENSPMIKVIQIK